MCHCLRHARPLCTWLTAWSGIYSNYRMRWQFSKSIWEMQFEFTDIFWCITALSRAVRKVTIRNTRTRFGTACSVYSMPGLFRHNTTMGRFLVMIDQHNITTVKQTTVCKHLNPFAWLNKFNIYMTPHSTVPVPGLLGIAPDLWESFTFVLWESRCWLLDKVVLRCRTGIICTTNLKQLKSKTLSSSQYDSHYGYIVTK